MVGWQLLESALDPSRFRGDTADVSTVETVEVENADLVGQVGEGHGRRGTTGTRRQKFRSVIQTTWPFKRLGRLNGRPVEVLRRGRDPLH